MALSVKFVDVSGFDANYIDEDNWKVFAAAQAGNLGAVAQTMGRPNFRAQAKTTDNTAASEVIDLTTRGVPLSANTVRKIRFRSMAVTDNDRWVQEWEQYVQGGTTPVLIGTPRLVFARGRIATAYVDYGRVRLAASYAVDTATVVAAPYTSAGVTIGDTSSGVATITHPIARSGARCLSVHASTDVTLNTEHRYPAVEAGVSSTTMELSLMAAGITSATGIVASFADVGFIDAELFILPPPSIALVMTSNNLELHCGHDATDDVYHFVDVWIGPNEFNALVAD